LETSCNLAVSNYTVHYQVGYSISKQLYMHVHFSEIEVRGNNYPCKHLYSTQTNFVPEYICSSWKLWRPIILCACSL